MVIHHTRLAAIGALIALAMAGCASSGAESPSSTVPEVQTTVTQPQTVGFETPEALVENIIATIQGADMATLAATLPAETWDTVEAFLMGGFDPQPGDPVCADVTDSAALCYVFDGRGGSVLELDAAPGERGWIVTRAVIDSTD